jgi:hypothetical protein
MKIKLHYAPLILKKDIECFEFKSTIEVDRFIYKMIYDGPYMPNKVILINIDNEILITDNMHSDPIIENFIEFMCYNDYMDEDAIPYMNIYLQEYYSYEEAYEVALSMKEENPLCYKTNFKLSKN